MASADGPGDAPRATSSTTSRWASDARVQDPGDKPEGARTGRDSARIGVVGHEDDLAPTADFLQGDRPPQGTASIIPGNTGARRSENGHGPENAHTGEDSRRMGEIRGQDEQWRGSAISSVIALRQERATIPLENARAQRQLVEEKEDLFERHSGGDSDGESVESGTGHAPAHGGASAATIAAAPMNSMLAITLAYWQAATMGFGGLADHVDNIQSGMPVRETQRTSAVTASSAPPTHPLPPPILPPPSFPGTGVVPTGQRLRPQSPPNPAGPTPFGAVSQTSDNKAGAEHRQGIRRRLLSVKRASQAFQHKLGLAGRRHSQASDAGSDDSWACATARLLESEHVRQPGAGGVVAEMAANGFGSEEIAQHLCQYTVGSMEALVESAPARLRGDTLGREPHHNSLTTTNIAGMRATPDEQSDPTQRRPAEDPKASL
ncbi:hypothetical protein LTR08_007585 [Meristemomyces frigidus]|nr:hypothetical protein LTR08_007585 [Meristemomyces frigidus]